MRSLREKDLALENAIREGLRTYEARVARLPGIASERRRLALVMQFIESVRRVRFIGAIASRAIDPRRVDPGSELFDPIRAALLLRSSDIEEAYWLLFLFVHFGKNVTSGWQLIRDVYGRLGQGEKWSWTRVQGSPKAFQRWIATNEKTLRGGDGIHRGFGNHRKYESLRTASRRGTGRIIESYVNWIGHFGSHQALANNAMQAADGDPRAAFANWYVSMAEVLSFGRTARFDLLTMIGKTGLARIEPNSPYLQGSTGPLVGARLLFHGNLEVKATWRELEKRILSLEGYLSLGPFAMQVLEDGLCNWQKSPSAFVPFRG